MKYIINIPDDTSYVNIVKLSGGCVSKVKTVYIPELTPYIEPDRKQIENEVWSLAETLIDEMTSDEVLEVTGNRCLFELSYQEAKERYEAWLKQKDNVIKQKVFDLAEEIGIHKLYAIVREIRGE